MHMSDNMRILTGFTRDITEEFYSASELEYDLTGGMSTLYIYTPSLIKPVNVGDVVAPLLATVVYDTGGDFSQQKQFQVKNPVYLPLRTTLIKTVEVQILNKSSVPAKFTSGEVVLLIHIRKKQNSII